MKLRIISAALIFSFFILLPACSGDVEIPHVQFNADGASWSGFRSDAEYLAVFGDVQSYVSSAEAMPYFKVSAIWLGRQKQLGAPLKCVLYDGDLTDNNSARQWSLFAGVALPLAEELLSIPCCGNHDFDWLRDHSKGYNTIFDRNSCHLSQYFRSPLLEANIDDRFRPDSIDNIVVRNEIAGNRIDIISLEFGARPEVLQWTDSIISSHPDRKYILMTHELLESDGTTPKGTGFAGMQFGPSGLAYSSPQEILDFIGERPSIIAALCGHNGFFVTAEIDNSVGAKTPVVLFNLQYQEHGGDGQLMLWEFEKERRVVNLYIICVLQGRLDAYPLPLMSFTY